MIHAQFVRGFHELRCLASKPVMSVRHIPRNASMRTAVHGDVEPIHFSHLAPNSPTYAGTILSFGLRGSGGAHHGWE